MGNMGVIPTADATKSFPKWRKVPDARLWLPISLSAQKSCSFPNVAMVQTTNFRQLNHLSQFRSLNGSRHWGITFQGQVTSRSMVVLKVTVKDTAQVLFVQHDDMVQAFSPDGTDQPFDVWILPRGSRRSENFLYPQVLDSTTEILPIDAVAIP